MSAVRSRPFLMRGGRAEAALEGHGPADLYVEPTQLQGVTAAAAVHAEPDPRSHQLDQLLFGERFEVLEVEDGFAYGRVVRDEAVGWVSEAALGSPAPPTHRVQSLRAFAYAAPDLSAPAAGPFPINALVSVEAGQGRFLHDPRAGWLVESDLAPIGRGFEADPAGVALRLLGAPYRTGARDGVGVDAPGLLQLALHACGLACPRSLEAQARLGRPISSSEDLARNDVVSWPVHTGIMLDSVRLLSADPQALTVVIEPLPSALARLASTLDGSAPRLRRL